MTTLLLVSLALVGAGGALYAAAWVIGWRDERGRARRREQ